MNDIQKICYTAGLFDGEGTVTLTSHHKGKHRAPSVTVSSTTPELLLFLQSEYGGAISTISKKRSHWKQAQSWSLCRNGAIVFLERVLPYIKEPEKYRRAHLIVTQYKSVTSPNGKYTEELLQRKKDFEAEFFQNSSSGGLNLVV